jgi:1-acyl-sn-glycerol-3-phosphate acyltransferase
MSWEKSFMRAGAVFEAVSRPFVTIELQAAGRLVNGEAVLMAANHRSLADVFVSLICCYRLGRPTRFIVGRVFFKRPGMGQFLRRIGCIEGGKGSGADVVAIEAIRLGSTCAIMPEGAVKTMEPGRILAPLLPGVSEIWEKAQCPFHAVGISGAGDVWPHGQLLPRPRRRNKRPLVHVRFDTAVLPGGKPCSLDRISEIMEANYEIAATTHREALSRPRS